jgi:hypothetical protein
MAGAALTVDMADDDLLPAWQTVVEVAGTGIAENLTLVGGLMVAVHARRADVVMRRPTDDMDEAIDRRDLCTLTFTSGASVELGVPDELGVLVAKGAAYLVDNRDRGRHLDDAAVLFACVSDASELDYEGMSQNDRRRLRAVLEPVGSDAHSSWVALDDGARARGLMNAHLIGGALL